MRLTCFELLILSENFLRKFPVAQNADPRNDETTCWTGKKGRQNQDVACADIPMKDAAQLVRFAMPYKNNQVNIMHERAV